MNESAVLIPEKIHLKEFKIIKGQIDSPEDIKVKHINSFHSEVSFDMAFNLKDKMIRSDIQVSVLSNSNSKNKEEANTFFHIVYFFAVENLPELVQETKPQHVEVNPGLANAIASISYSTTRGILLTRLQGTAFRDFILPVINPNGLLK